MTLRRIVLIGWFFLCLYPVSVDGIGVNYAFPQKKVVCVSGDGSFMMELQELATAARCGFPI